MLPKIFILLCLFIVPCSAQAKTLYVNGGTGSDATTYANNTALAPWATIGRAAWGSTNRAAPNASEAAQAGDIVTIADGTYNASAGSAERYIPAYNPANSGTLGSPITFKATNNLAVILQSTNGTGPVIGSYNKDYIVWDGFYIDEANVNSRADTGPVVVWEADHCIIKNLEVKSKTTAWVDNHNGIRVEGSNYTEIRNCKIYDVGDNGGYGQNASAVMLYNSNDTLIENNEFYHCGSGVFIKGITIGTQARTIIRKNLIYTMGWAGLTILGSDGALVYQNILRDNAISVDMYTLNGDHENNKIVNNVFVRATGTGGSGGHILTRGDDANGYDGSIIQNNICMTSAYGNVVTDVSYGASAPNITFEHNNYYNFTADKFWYSEGAASKTFANWKTDFGKDDLAPDSITTDPLFTDFDNNDFTLQAGSPALTLGVDVLDLDGDSSTTDTVPAGAYITGSEVIGIDEVVDVTAPTLSSVTIGANGVSWTFSYNEIIYCASTPNCCNDYTVTTSTAGAITLSYASGTGTSSVVCTGSPGVLSIETITAGLDYTTVANGIEDLAGNDLASINDKAVTNSSTQAYPVFSSATIDTTGRILSVTYDQNVRIGSGGTGGVTLTSCSGGAVTIAYTSNNGATVVYGEPSRTIQSGETSCVLGYTQPGNGIEANNSPNYLDVQTYSGQAVTNNSTAGAGVTPSTVTGLTISGGSF